MFGLSSGDEDVFDSEDAFVPDHLPAPGSFLDGHEVLTGDDHVEFHRVSTEIFEARGVYDATFGYNLGRLNLDARHPDAGYRYARDADDPRTIRAEFTPTTPFCPQSQTLAVGSLRAWNDLAADFDYDFDRVVVRVGEMHHQSEAVNARLEALESEE